MARASCGCRTGEFTECVTNGSSTVEHDGDYHVGPAVSFFFGDDGQWCRSVDDLNDVHDRSVVNWCFAVYPGAWCSPEGAVGTYTNGKTYVCSKTNQSGTPYSDGRARWRRA